jgi:hypothetical protein
MPIKNPYIPFTTTKTVQTGPTTTNVKSILELN